MYVQKEINFNQSQMRINYFLLIKIVVIEILYSTTAFFIFLFSFFGYFGSGASVSSELANIWGCIGQITIYFPPILFNFYKIIKLKKSNNFTTFISAQIILLLLFSLAWRYDIFLS